MVAASVLRDNYAPADMARMLLRHYGELKLVLVGRVEELTGFMIFMGITWESCGNEKYEKYGQYILCIYIIYIHVLITYVCIYI